MSANVTTAFTITREEYVRAVRRHYRSVLHVKRDLVGGLVGIIFGIVLLRTTQSSTVGWFLIVSSGVLELIVMCAIFVLPQWIYRSQPKLRDEYRLEFGEDGIGFQTNAIDAQLQWSFYHSWLRDDEFYILYHGTRDISVIPRRAIRGDNDERFVDLLHRKLGPSRK